MSDKPQPDPSDEELMTMYQHGSMAAGAMLFERYQGPLLGYLVRMVRNRSDAEEMLQEVFLRVHESRHTYAGYGSFSSWLYRIATNRCLNFLETRKSRHSAGVLSLNGGEQIGLGGQDPGSNPRDHVFGGEMADLIEVAIGNLPVELRAVFLLRQKAELGYAEISQMLGVPENRLRVQFHRARKMLYGQLKRNIPDLEES